MSCLFPFDIKVCALLVTLKLQVQVFFQSRNAAKIRPRGKVWVNRIDFGTIE